MFAFGRLLVVFGFLSALVSAGPSFHSRPTSRSDSDSSDDATISYLSDMFNVLNTAGWTNFTSYLADDLVWTVTGETPISGVWNGKQAYVDNVFKPLDEYLEVWPTPVINKTITQDDWATVMFDSHGGLGKNGLDYSMQYAWLMKVNVNDTTPAKIHQVIGFYDHVKVIQLFNTSYTP